MNGFLPTRARTFSAASRIARAETKAPSSRKASSPNPGGTIVFVHAGRVVAARARLRCLPRLHVPAGARRCGAGGPVPVRVPVRVPGRRSGGRGGSGGRGDGRDARFCSRRQPPPRFGARKTTPDDPRRPGTAQGTAAGDGDAAAGDADAEEGGGEAAVKRSAGRNSSTHETTRRKKAAFRTGDERVASRRFFPRPTRKEHVVVFLILPLRTPRPRTLASLALAHQARAVMRVYWTPPPTRAVSTPPHGDNMPPSLVGALDQGTTSTREDAIESAAGAKLTAVASHQMEHKQIFPQPGWCEHDPEEIVANAHECMSSALAKVPGGATAADVACVGITNQRRPSWRGTPSGSWETAHAPSGGWTRARRRSAPTWSGTWEARTRCGKPAVCPSARTSRARKCAGCWTTALTRSARSKNRSLRMGTVETAGRLPVRRTRA